MHCSKLNHQGGRRGKRRQHIVIKHIPGPEAWIPDFFAGAATWRDVFRTTRKLLAPYGVGGINYGLCHSLKRALEYGLLSTLETWSDYPESYVDRLYSTGLAEADISARYIIEHKQPFVWSRADVLALTTPLEAARSRLDEEFGMTVGITFPVWLTEYAGSGFGIWTPDLSADEFDRMWNLNGENIKRIAQSLDVWMRRNALKARYRLSQREKDVLGFTGGGLSSIQIAAHLKVSHRTVEGALARARDRLKAQNTTEAVAKALIFNLI